MFNFEDAFWYITPIHLKIKKMNDFWKEMRSQYPILQEWKFEWTSLYSSCGLTQYSSKTIKMSLFLLIGNTSLKDVKNIILHEIAHVLTEEEKKQHGFLWKRCFIKMGGDGKRTSEMNIPNIFYNWHFICKNKRCLEYKKRITYFYVKKWKRKRCSKCKSFMKKSFIGGGEDRIKNGYAMS